MTDDQKAAVGGAALGEVECMFEAVEVHAGEFANLRGILEGAPAPLAVGRREIFFGTGGRRKRQDDP